MVEDRTGQTTVRPDMDATFRSVVLRFLKLRQSTKLEIVRSLLVHDDDRPKSSDLEGMKKALSRIREMGSVHSLEALVAAEEERL
jgi:hypothetical protein